jgi:ABC-type polysaccharide/polyol phosphate transport system ATPase subunit
MARVVVENVRVDFPIYGTQRNLRKILLDRAAGGLIQHQGKKQDRVVVEALVGLSMTLEDGDRLGLIGHNGSGKSTLLKVLAGIYEPIEGRLLVEGRVTPLFDMMPGIDAEDSGYENIITCGLLLGLTRDEIEAKIPNVEEFSELGEYLALPVRTYSAGMMTRLGFALVTALDPGVLLMDEGIGAGDARFAERAEKRLNEFVGRSQIVVLASHNPAMIKSICNKGALLQAGRLIALGPVEEIIEQYEQIVRGPRPPVPAWHCASFASDPGACGDAWAECIGGTVETLDGEICQCPEIDVPYRICLRYRLLKDSQNPMVPNFHFHDGLGHAVMVACPEQSGPTGRGEYQACCAIAPFNLNTGRYSVGLALSSAEPETRVHFHVPLALRFEVVERPGVDQRRHGRSDAWPGVTRLRLDWTHGALPAAPAASDAGGPR